MSRPLCIAAALCLVAACSKGSDDSGDSKQRGGAARDVDLRGLWRGVLSSPGGPLPFGLRIDGAGADPPAVLLNAGEETPVSRLEIEGRKVALRFESSDSRLEAQAAQSGERMSGLWRASGGELPFTAVRGGGERFAPKPNVRAAFESVAGTWEVSSAAPGSEATARAQLIQDGQKVTGSFAARGEEHRGLEGTFTGGLLRMSRFDGDEAVLLRGHARSGGKLVGDLWIGAGEHVTWRAERPAQ